MKNFFSKMKIHAPTLHQNGGIDPHAHWKLLLRLFGLLSAGLIVFSFYLLYQIQTEQVFQADTKTDGPSNLIKEKTLQSVTRESERRKEVQGALRANPKKWEDPSV